MLKLSIQINEEKVLREKVYSLRDIHTLLDNTFLKHGLRKGSIEDKALIYLDNGSPNDYANFWKIIWSLAKKEWFMANVEHWLWYNSDDGDNEDDFSVEDILDYCHKKQIGA